MVAAIVLALMTAGAWSWARRLAQHRALLEQVAEGEPEAAMAALDRLAGEPDADLEELRALLLRREAPLDVLERGAGGIDEERRSAAVLRVAEIALPILEETPEDPVLLASMVWALDFMPGRDPALAERALDLRDRMLEPLRRHWPPPAPGHGDPDWVDLPGGTFWMGSAPGEGRDGKFFRLRERPRHQVTVSPVRMSRHPVTNREYRRLVPDHLGTANLPVRLITWYQAWYQLRSAARSSLPW